MSCSPLIDQCGSDKLQATRCKSPPKVGFALQTLRKTTTLDARHIRMELPRGSSKGTSLMSGTKRVPFCGFTENVRSQH